MQCLNLYLYNGKKGLTSFWSNFVCNLKICDDIQACELISNSFAQNEKFGDVTSEMCYLYHKDFMLQK